MFGMPDPEELNKASIVIVLAGYKLECLKLAADMISKNDDNNMVYPSADDIVNSANKFFKFIAKDEDKFTEGVSNNPNNPDTKFK